MPPRLVNREGRKKYLAAKALELFAEKGFEATTINDVSMAAGIAKGTVYEYFRSKEDLVFTAIMLWVDGFEAELSDLSTDKNDPEGRLLNLVHSSVELFLNDSRTTKITASIFHMILTGSRLLKKHDLIRDAFSGFRRMFVNIFLQGVSKGVFRPEVAKDAEKLAINLLAYLDGIALHYLLSENFINIREQVDLYMQDLLKNLKGARA